MSYLIFANKQGRGVAIHDDGRVVFDTDVTPDEAARIFWDAVKDNVATKQAQRISELSLQNSSRQAEYDKAMARAADERTGYQRQINELQARIVDLETIADELCTLMTERINDLIHLISELHQPVGVSERQATLIKKQLQEHLSSIRTQFGAKE